MKREDSPWIAAGFTSEWWKHTGPPQREQFLNALSDLELEQFYKDWRVWGRDKQLPPESMPDGTPWRTWLLVCGRGFGKTRTAVEFIRDEVENARAGRVAIVGQGDDDIRSVMVEGESGFLQTAPSWCRPRYTPSVGGGRLTWPNGAIGTIYSAEDPEALRGPQFDLAWVDEPMAMPAAKRQKAMSNLKFGLRLGTNPRLVITTTPKPHQWMREQIAAAANPRKKIYLTRGSTYENQDNLADSFIEGIQEDYEGTRLGQQEIHGELLGMEEGALWDYELLARSRLMCPDTESYDWPSQLLVAFANACDRVIVAVDPNIKTNGTAHAAGIIVVGKRDENFFVIADRTTKGGPDAWSQGAVAAALEFDADEIVAESNQGGEMVRTTLRHAMQNWPIIGEEPNFSIHLTHASKGKTRRAEPVATLYSRGRVQHLGDVGTSEKPGPLYRLEQQMANIHDGADPTGEDFDRADALVWGLTRLGRKKTSASRNGAAGGFQTLRGPNSDGAEQSADQFNLWERAGQLAGDPV